MLSLPDGDRLATAGFRCKKALIFGRSPARSVSKGGPERL